MLRDYERAGATAWVLMEANRVSTGEMNGVFQALGPDGFGTYRIQRDQWTPTNEPATGTLSPGLVDLHIHGAFGVDFMSASTADILNLCNQLFEIGYEAWLPTTVTANPDDIQKALENLPQHPMIPGFHLEGPFLSPSYPGAQPPQAILDPPDGASEWDSILDDPRLKLITLAPERPNALQLTKRLTERGVRVNMGHTDASFFECRAGFNAGMRGATHTFNAMRPLHHREAGAVGFVLAEEEMDAELIYDRIHVSPDAASLLVKVKAPGHLIAVSDSTMASGLEEGTELTMWGLECIVGDKQIRLKSNGALAGSGITLKDAFQNLAEDFGPEVAIRASCHNPRLAIGLLAPPRVHLLWNKHWDLVDRFELQ